MLDLLCFSSCESVEDAKERHQAHYHCCCHRHLNEDQNNVLLHRVQTMFCQSENKQPYNVQSHGWCCVLGVLCLFACLFVFRDRVSKLPIMKKGTTM